MATLLKSETVEIMKITAPVLKQHGLNITKVFYKNLFENHPEAKNFFNMAHIFPSNGEISKQVRYDFDNTLSTYSVLKK